jgi:hypothetical protein
VPDEFYDRIAEAARSCGLAAELNSSGWRRPCAEAYPAPALLARFHDLGVPITTASDGTGLAPFLGVSVTWPRQRRDIPRSQHFAGGAKWRSHCRTPNFHDPEMGHENTGRPA